MSELCHATVSQLCHAPVSQLCHCFATVSMVSKRGVLAMNNRWVWKAFERMLQAMNNRKTSWMACQFVLVAIDYSP